MLERSLDGHIAIVRLCMISQAELSFKAVFLPPVDQSITLSQFVLALLTVDAQQLGLED